MNRLVAVSLFFSCSLLLAAETPPPPLWENSAEASLLVTSGNTDLSTIGLGILSIYRPDPWTVKGKGNALSGKSNGVKTAESYELGLRGERKLSEPLSVYVSTSYLKNEFAGFKDRFGGEAGVAYDVFTEGEHSLKSELGIGLLKENLISGPGGTSRGDRSFANGRLGLDYKWKFSTSAELGNTLSLMDNFQTTQDWRLSNITSLTALLTDLLSLKLSFKVDYLNQPVAPKKTDTTTSVALIAKF